MWERKGPLHSQEMEGLAPHEISLQTRWDWAIGSVDTDFSVRFRWTRTIIWQNSVWWGGLSSLARDSRLLLGYLSTSVGIPSFFSYNVDVGVRKKTGNYHCHQDPTVPRRPVSFFSRFVLLQYLQCLLCLGRKRDSVFSEWALVTFGQKKSRVRQDGFAREAQYHWVTARVQAGGFLENLLNSSCPRSADSVSPILPEPFLVPWPHAKESSYALPPCDLIDLHLIERIPSSHSWPESHTGQPPSKGDSSGKGCPVMVKWRKQNALHFPFKNYIVWPASRLDGLRHT